jgi:hypothetical protein
MGSDFEHIWANGAIARGYLGEDASDGTVFLYGLWSGDYQDLGVAHWKYLGASGQYSTHTKTRVYTSTGGALPTVNVNGETGFSVARGQAVQVEFTYENNGKTSQNVDTGWYVSTNDFISSTDRLLASTKLTLARDNAYTYRRTVTIPTNLTRGVNYWLGTIVDRTGAVADRVRNNNATYVPIRVQ